MGSKKHTRESIILALQGLANRLRKNVLSTNDVAVHLAGHLPLSSINSCFGSLGNALEAAGLERTLAWSHLAARGNVLSDDKRAAGKCCNTLGNSALRQSARKTSGRKVLYNSFHHKDYGMRKYNSLLPRTLRH